jgi:catechol 2,3-dioxygenase-like lactoylglutathione lyase family enzyme
MTIDWIDHVVVPVKSLEEASAAYERLGLTLTPVTRHAGLGTENRVFFVGDGTNDFYVELLAIHDPAAAGAQARAAVYVQALAEGRGLARLMLGTNDLAGTVAHLSARGVETAIEPISREGGAKICDVAALEGLAGIGMPASLIQYVESRATSHARRAGTGLFGHGFPLKRLDHLAAMAPEIETATHAWTDVLGVPVFGEIRAPGMIIRQLKMGDGILELLGPDGPESPMASRPPGLASMCAFEVKGRLDDAVALARERGFTPSEPRAGVLPGTRVATIPGGELSGLGLQLLEYV